MAIASPRAISAPRDPRASQFNKPITHDRGKPNGPALSESGGSKGPVLSERTESNGSQRNQSRGPALSERSESKGSPRGGSKGAAFNQRESKGPKAEPKIIFQTFFKSVGPRTYASQVKELSNGNQLMVITEGKRDDTNGEVRKTRLFVFAEDFPAFFEMMKTSADFIKAHPLPESIRNKRAKFWAKKDAESKSPVPGRV